MKISFMPYMKRSYYPLVTLKNRWVLWLLFGFSFYKNFQPQYVSASPRLWLSWMRSTWRKRYEAAISYNSEVGGKERTPLPFERQRESPRAKQIEPGKDGKPPKYSIELLPDFEDVNESL